MKKLVFGQSGIIEMILLLLLMLIIPSMQWFGVSSKVLLIIFYLYITYSIVTIFLATYFFLRKWYLQKKCAINYVTVAWRLAFLICSLNLLGYYFKIPFSMEPWIITIIVYLLICVAQYIEKWTNKKSTMPKGEKD